MPTKMLVCLANSYKHGGRCVAGIEVGDGSHTWIRPVSSRSGHEVSATERQYAGGVEPQILDIVSIEVKAHRPLGFQRENWLLDHSVRWRKIGRFGRGQLSTLESRPENLWINGESTQHGTNDRMPSAAAQLIPDSLRLIRVTSVTVKVESTPQSFGGHLAVRAQFPYSGFLYTLKITDPVYKEKFQSKGPGSYKLGTSFLTISLGEEYEGYLYKMVAAIIECTGPDMRTAR